MCCIGSICKCTCKCIKWICIILLIAILLALIIAIIIIAVALHGTQTLQKAAGLVMSCAKGECDNPSGTGDFAWVMSNFVSSYDEDCGTSPSNVNWSAPPAGSGETSYFWELDFTFNEGDTFGVEITPLDGRDENGMLVVTFDFDTPDDRSDDSSQTLNKFSLKNVNIDFEGWAFRFESDTMTFPSAAEALVNDAVVNRRNCIDYGRCKAAVIAMDAHFRLKFRNVPDFLCLKFNSTYDVGKFMDDVGSFFSKVNKDMGNAIKNFTVADDFKFPNGDPSTCAFAASFDPTVWPEIPTTP